MQTEQNDQVNGVEIDGGEVDETIPATIHELNVAFPTDPGFAKQCFARSMTMVQSKIAWNRKNLVPGTPGVKGKLEKLEKRRKRLEKMNAEPPPPGGSIFM